MWNWTPLFIQCSKVLGIFLAKIRQQRKPSPLSRQRIRLISVDLTVEYLRSLCGGYRLFGTYYLLNWFSSMRSLCSTTKLSCRINWYRSNHSPGSSLIYLFIKQEALGNCLFFSSYVRYLFSTHELERRDSEIDSTSVGFHGSVSNDCR